MIAHSNEPSVRDAHAWSTPRTPDALLGFIERVLGFDMPRTARTAGHDGPLAYLAHAFFEDRLPRDCVVWANRGGGKTQLGAIATLLDLVFKPGIEVRILGGSLDQSSKMFGYLRAMLMREDLAHMLSPRIRARTITLSNGSHAEVLAQSETSVRGQRVHRLRCDEVELFDPDIWRAAQLVTRSGPCGGVPARARRRSGPCGGVPVRASIEAVSTMHRPFGLMHDLIHGEQSSPVRRVFRWNVIDVLRTCEPERACDSCLLWDDCRGRAKQGIGFLDIDDAIQQKQRVDERTWRAEMLCEAPLQTNAVYTEFSEAEHVRDFDIDTLRRRHPEGQWWGGIDFGFTSLTVLLWAYVTKPDDDLHRHVYVVDELVEKEKRTDELVDLANARRWPRPDHFGADPSGNNRTEHAGKSLIAMWNERGWKMTFRRSEIEPGVAAVRRLLRSADGRTRLTIHPRCTELIRSMATYRYPKRADVEDVRPHKDGADHACDALRYMVINLESPVTTKRRDY